MTGIIDIAMAGSLCKKGEFHKLLNEYGLVLIDECHHSASETIANVLKEVKAKYVYGVTATPKRGDGNNILKEYMSIVSRRKSLVNGYMISIQFSQIVGHVYKMYHVLNRRQKYIFHSVIENTTRMKNWRRNVFMCMKEYGVMRRVGKIQIIHSIGQRVNFAKGVDNICMNILI